LRLLRVSGGGHCVWYEPKGVDISKVGFSKTKSVGSKELGSTWSRP
jgi:hypothetical protein